MGTSAPHVADYIPRAELARRLHLSESAIDDYVQRGILPKPIRLGSSVRWRWETVDRALASLEGRSDDCVTPNDREGVQRAIQATKDRGRGRTA